MAQPGGPQVRAQHRDREGRPRLLSGPSLGGELRDEAEDLVILWEALHLVLGEDSFFVNPHVEDSALAPHEGRVDCKALSDRSRQTGGPG